MAEFRVVTAVRLLAGGHRVESVMCGVAETNTGQWVQPPAELPVIDIVDALMHGDTVFTTYPTPAGNVPGPRLRVIVHAGGIEGIETDPRPNEQPRTVADLPRF